MNGTDDDRSKEQVREHTIEDLLVENELDDLIRMRREMRDELDATDNDREADLLEYRLGILEDTIDRVED